jgi:hypothetical protein
MALVKCAECGREVSATAATCPHCGKANPGASAGAKAFGVFVVAAMIAALLYWILS